MEVIDYMSMLLKLYLVKYNVPSKLKKLMKFHYILASSVLIIYTRGKLTMGAKGLEGGGTTRGKCLWGETTRGGNDFEMKHPGLGTGYCVDSGSQT